MSKGAGVCPDGLRISERQAGGGAPRNGPPEPGPEFQARFASSFQRLWAAADAAEAAPPPTLETAEMRALEAKRARLVSLVENDHGDIESLLERLRTLERQIRALRARRVETTAPPCAGHVAPGIHGHSFALAGVLAVQRVGAAVLVRDRLLVHPRPSPS